MKIIGPQDLVPEPPEPSAELQKAIDAAVMAHYELLIKGKLILTGDGDGERKKVR